MNKEAVFSHPMVNARIVAFIYGVANLSSGRAFYIYEYEHCFEK